MRRVGNLYYSRCFANAMFRVFREMLPSQGRLTEVMKRILVFAASSGDEMENLIPTHGRHVWKIFQDLFRLDIVEHMVENHMMEYLRGNEMQIVTVDCSVKIALATMGQAKASAIKKNPASAAYSETDHRRRVLSIRGRTGAVLLMEPAREENVHDLSSTFLRCLKGVFRERVRYVCVDKPSRAMVINFPGPFSLGSVLQGRPFFAKDFV